MRCVMRPARPSAPAPFAAMRMISGRTESVAAPVRMPSLLRMGSLAPLASSAIPDRPSVVSTWALQLVGLADELGDEKIGGPVVDLLRRGKLDDAPRIHHADLIAHRQRLFLVMRDQQEGYAKVAVQVLQLQLHGRAQLLVERRQRLVEQQHARLVDQCPRQRDALLLPAGKLVDLSLAIGAQMHHLQRLADAPADLAAVDARPRLLQSVGDVALHVEMGKQRVALEDHVYRPPVGRHARHGHAVHQHLAAGRLLETADHAKARSLAAARRAQQRDERALWNLQAHIVDRHDIAVALHNGAEFDVEFRHRNAFPGMT